MSHPDVREIALAWGRALRGRRKAQGVTMAAAADAAGMSRLTWHRLESGEPSVAWRYVLAAAAVLGLEPTLHTDASDASSAEVNAFDEWLPLSIRVDEFPGLRRLAWQVHEGAGVLSPREAWQLYERNVRHLPPDGLAPREEALLAGLRKVYGGARADL